VADPVPARLSAAEGRKFGLTVGLAFLALSALLAWRGKPHGAWVAGAAGALLVTTGILIPGRLGPVRDAWMRLAEAISRVTTPIFMAIVYFVVITPMGLLLRLAGHRALSRKPSVAGFWVIRAADDHRSDLSRQF
jgi:hypothetical protein